MKFNSLTKLACFGFGLLSITLVTECAQQADSNLIFDQTEAVALPELPEKKPTTADYHSGVMVDDNKYHCTTYDIIVDSDTVKIYGWAADIDAKAATPKMLMEVNGKCFPINFNQKRPDVNKLLGIDEKVNTGYTIKMSKELLRSENGSMAKSISFHRYNATGDSLLSPVSYKLLYLTAVPDYPKSAGGATFALDVVQDKFPNHETHTVTLHDGQYISCSGWCTESGAPLTEMYVTVGSHTLKANYGTQREDVQKARNLSTDKVGYNVQIPMCLFKNADGSKATEIVFTPVNGAKSICPQVSYSIVYE